MKRFAALALLLAACGTGTDDSASSAGAVTAIDATAVKEQVIGTCWIYATAAWAESLHLEATGRSVDLSESYWTYWTFYDRIVNGKANEYGYFEETGTWGDAAELIARYGVMREADFLPPGSDAPNEQDALNEIFVSLSAGGKLATPASRRDRALVRAELDAAFKLRPATVAWLDAAFGKDGKAVLNAGGTIPSGSPIASAKDFAVAAGAGKTRTLADFVGVDLPNIDPNRRTGLYAWQYAPYPRTDAAARRTLLARVQRALNDRLPVLVSWQADHAAVDAAGVFRTPGPKDAIEAHLSLITDYQASSVPGFGTLAVGQKETRPEALAAALAPTSTIDLLRIKNSWGAKPRQTSAIPPGYYDLTRAYYDASFEACNSGDCVAKPALTYVILPNGY